MAVGTYLLPALARHWSPGQEPDRLHACDGGGHVCDGPVARRRLCRL